MDALQTEALRIDPMEVFAPENYQYIGETPAEIQDLANKVDLLVRDISVTARKSEITGEKRDVLSAIRLQRLRVLGNNLKFMKTQLDSPDLPESVRSDLEYDILSTTFDYERLNRTIGGKERGYKYLKCQMDTRLDALEAECWRTGMINFLNDHVVTGGVGPCTITFLGEEYSYSE